MQYIIEWTNCIIAVTVLFTIIELLIPEGNQKKTILMITGIMTTIVIATPVIKLFGDNFDMSEVFSIDEFTADSDLSFDKVLEQQIYDLQKTYSQNIMKNFNGKYPKAKIDECNVFFNKDIYGKIEDIARIEITTSKNDENMRKRISEIAEVEEDKITILIMTKEENENGKNS